MMLPVQYESSVEGSIFIMKDEVLIVGFTLSQQLNELKDESCDYGS